MLTPSFSPFPEITTDRLLLRQMSFADARSVLRLRSNENVMRHINRPLTLTIEEAEKWIGVVLDNLRNNAGITWCLCLKEEPANHIGSIGLWRIENENYRAEIGYMLEPSLQGKGFMYEAIEAVIHYGFTEIELHSIEAQIDPRNQASAALLKKAGFIQEAYFKENCFHNGEFTDSAVFSLLTPFSKTIHTTETAPEATTS